MIEWIVSSSVLILLVLAIRALAKGRLSCRARYCLWLLALVRLLVPVQLFTASWGVAEAEVPEVVVTHRDDAGLQLAPVEPDPSLPREEQEAQWRENRAEYEAEMRRGRIEYGTPVTLAEILRVVWLAGAGVMAIVLLVSNLRFARRLRRVRVPYDALVGGMRVYVAEGISSPCLVGVLHPTVYLTPACTRDERTLRHVLAHETTHRLHGDCLWSLLRLAALSLHWYNPLVWLAVIVSKRDGELACDEATLARLGEDERVAYGETLLTLVRSKPTTRELLSASTAMTAGRKPMRERIETIARHPRTKGVALALAVSVLLTATVFAFSRAKAEKATPMTAREALDALEASVVRGAESVSFTIPEGFDASGWDLQINGHAFTEDGERYVEHWLWEINDNHAWQAGRTYQIPLQNVDTIHMDAFVFDENGEQLERYIGLKGEQRASGAYASVEDYVASVRAGMTAAAYYAGDGGEKAANVLDTRVKYLEKRGELSGLAPDGTLERYDYLIETKLDVPLEQVRLVGGMYDTEDGWCDLEGKNGHALVVLRYADGSVDALHDQPNNDDDGGLYYYEESVEETLHDWYVKKYGLDLPLYTIALTAGDGSGGQDEYPAYRVDGDGWYLYVPIWGWYRVNDEHGAHWYSQYNTGSTLLIREASAEERSADRPALAPGQAERFVDAPDGRTWLVWTQYDPKQIAGSPYVEQEAKALEAMAAAFTADARVTAPRTAMERYARVTPGRYEGNGWSVDVPSDNWTMEWDDFWRSTVDKNAYFSVDWGPNSVFNTKAGWAEIDAWPYRTDMPAPFDGYYSLTHWTHEVGGSHEEMYFVEGPENSCYTLNCTWDSDNWNDELVAELHAMLQSFTVDERLNKDDSHLISSLLRSSSLASIRDYRVYDGEEQPATLNEEMLHQLRLASYSLSALDLPTDEVLGRYVTITYGTGAEARKLYVYASTQPPYLLLRLEGGSGFVQEYNQTLYTLLSAYQAGYLAELFDLSEENLPVALVKPDGGWRTLLYRYLGELGADSIEVIDLCETFDCDWAGYAGYEPDTPAAYRNTIVAGGPEKPTRYYRYERGQFTELVDFPAGA